MNTHRQTVAYILANRKRTNTRRRTRIKSRAAAHRSTKQLQPEPQLLATAWIVRAGMVRPCQIIGIDGDVITIRLRTAKEAMTVARKHLYTDHPDYLLHPSP